MAIENYHRLKLLFVDDALHTRTLLREVLRGTEWTNADIVDSAETAFKLIQMHPPDLVFTDWQMPGQSGLDLIRDIRERVESPDPLLPVILLTANGDAEHVLGACDAGANGFLVKPISLGRITERVVDVVTRPRSFIVSHVYRGPDRRRGGRPRGGEGQSQELLPPGAIVLPPDGLLLAKVRGEPGAIREALLRRIESIAIVRRFDQTTVARSVQHAGMEGVAE
jgi:CheY-like chemotaxis protein